MPLTLCCPVSQSVSCSVSSCTCVCFKARSGQLRSCDRCGHGWVAHGETHCLKTAVASRAVPVLEGWFSSTPRCHGVAQHLHVSRCLVLCSLAALEKLQVQPPSGCGPVEVALPGLVFDLSSLVLFGAQAVPVRLKILLDRLYSVLTPEQVPRPPGSHPAAQFPSVTPVVLSGQPHSANSGLELGGLRPRLHAAGNTRCYTDNGNRL